MQDAWGTAVAYAGSSVVMCGVSAPYQTPFSQRIALSALAVLVMTPSSRHSWFCEGNACVYPLLEYENDMISA